MQIFSERRNHRCSHPHEGWAERFSYLRATQTAMTLFEIRCSKSFALFVVATSSELTWKPVFVWGRYLGSLKESETALLPKAFGCWHKLCTLKVFYVELLPFPATSACRNTNTSVQHWDREPNRLARAESSPILAEPALRRAS